MVLGCYGRQLARSLPTPAATPTCGIYAVIVISCFILLLYIEQLGVQPQLSGRRPMRRTQASLEALKQRLVPGRVQNFGPLHGVEGQGRQAAR